MGEKRRDVIHRGGVGPRRKGSVEARSASAPGGFLLRRLLEALCWFCLCAAVSHAAGDSLVRGEAYDLRTGARAYVEVHQELSAGGRHVKTVTRYLGLDGRLIAERTLDFSRSAFKPDFLMEDHRDGYREGARVRDSAVTVFFRARAGKPLREKTLRVPEPCVVEGGFNGFVKAHWDSLLAGGALTFNFVAPSQLGYFAFVARMEPPGRVAGERTLVLEVRNPVLKLLVDPIRVTYALATRRILRYEGISNVNDARGKSLKVRILYARAAP